MMTTTTKQDGQWRTRVVVVNRPLPDRNLETESILPNRRRAVRLIFATRVMVWVLVDILDPLICSIKVTTIRHSHVSYLKLLIYKLFNNNLCISFRCLGGSFPFRGSYRLDGVLSELSFALFIIFFWCKSQTNKMIAHYFLKHNFLSKFN